jgi:hypothetical protein
MVDAEPQLVHRGDRQGGTPLHRAVAASAREVIGLLLDRGADIHALHGAGPGNAAGYAAADFQPIDLALFWHRRGDVETARLLLDRGAAYDVVIAAALGRLAVDTWPSDANFILFRPRGRDCAVVWDAPAPGVLAFARGGESGRVRAPVIIVAAGAMLGATALASAPAEADDKAPPAAAIAEPPAPTGPVMTLDQPSIDFGTIDTGKKTTVEFTFVNTGTQPLKLDERKLKSSCKCLVAILPREPIAPGAHGKIKATFTAPRTAGDASHNLVIKYTTDPVAKAEGSAVMSVVGVVRKRPRAPQAPRVEGRGFILS